MSKNDNITASFQVTSGALCFGSLLEISEGAAAPVRQSPHARPELGGGTVQVQPMAYNVAAKNGTWNAYGLVAQDSSFVVAWFIAHESVDEPLTELLKILRVAGCPYEYECGSQMNDDKTRANCVFVINRYDWGNNDHGEVRHKNGFENSLFIQVGLVDYGNANARVQEWREIAHKERGAASDGMWLYLEDDFRYGRFGFGDDYAQAQSFLLFGQSTCFFETEFPGEGKPLRKWETELERLRRGLAEGTDYSGVDTLREYSARQPAPGSNMKSLYTPRTPQAELLGPYDVDEYVLTAQDIEAIRAYGHDPANEEALACPRLAEFIDPWKEPVYDLLNEIFLSYLERDVVPVVRTHAEPSTIADALFPRREGQWHGWMFEKFTGETAALTIPGVDAVAAGVRIRAFLARRGSEYSSRVVGANLSDDFIARTARLAVAVVRDILECAHSESLGREDMTLLEGGYILPCSIRRTMYFGGELDPFECSACFWDGREAERDSC
ncbi:transposase [Purpureocillium lavendulum]|uniref:Transposase n=1 Tax=Purpureocillium lavendulum TaxID=1247861 RepID=A0AB34FJG6_9HYPO|nr:transposase [Purpureocillium lavendulum]